MKILADVPTTAASVFNPEALTFVHELSERFSPRLREILSARAARQPAFDAGTGFDFLEETSDIRRSEWMIDPAPAPLMDRRVEITGPVDRKMVINGMNSGANAFMADFEDSTAPTWRNVCEGQVNLFDATRRTISLVADDTGKRYELNPSPAVLLMRPRGLHLFEAHAEVNGNPVPASLFDFGFYVFHNAAESLRRGWGPYLYLPKLEHYLEARWHNDVFDFAEQTLGLPRGSIRATVLIETLPAAFQMDEILWELRAHSSGLNCGRWDYIFSFIKKRARDPRAILPDRACITMDRGFLQAYVRRLVQTCHRRGAHAMGGMAAQIPIKDDPIRNEKALERVAEDKRREVREGHDGTWVAHPGLVAIARKAFDDALVEHNQLARTNAHLPIGREDMLRIPDGVRTREGLRHNIRVGIQYLAAWLSGKGCVPLYDLMEDAATAEICRAQVWQWVHHRATLDDGSTVTQPLVESMISDECAAIDRQRAGEAGMGPHFIRARALFEALCFSPEFVEFLTLPAYSELCSANATGT